MKLKKTFALTAASLSLACACLLSGCVFTEVSNLYSDEWLLDLSGSTCIPTETGTTFGKFEELFVSGHMEFNSHIINIRLNRRDPDEEYSQPYEYYSFSINYYSYSSHQLFASSSGTDDHTTYLILSGDVATIHFTSYMKEYLCVFDLTFTKNGATAPKDPEPSDPPTDTTDNAAFEAIKTAYRDDGYEVDFDFDRFAPELQGSMQAVKDSYAAIGYDVCLIGKNLDDVLNLEYYLLLSAPTVQDAIDGEAALAGMQYRRSGKNLIVSYNTEANFAPFERATAGA